MLSHLKPLTALALLAVAMPLTAQEAADPPAEEAAPEAPATDDPATETPAIEAPAAEATPEAAPLATPEAAPADGVAAEPQVGETYIREEFGDWGIRCLRAEEAGEDPCQLYQLLLDDQGNAVAEISMFPLPAGGEAAAGATIVAPLETLLTEELTLSVDGTAARTYPFNFCNQAGCVARVGFTAEEVQQFKNGSAAQLSIVPAAAPDQRVDLTISLTGFTAGYDSTGVPAVVE